MAAATTIKALTVGSNFSFHLWVKYGRKYIRWYDKWMDQKFDPDSETE